MLTIHTSYKRKIKEYNSIFNDTLKIYRNAVDFLISAVNDMWDLVSEIKGAKLRMNFIEHSVHKTSKNPNPKYDFDSNFYKFPSYLRRAAIMDALGLVSSYRSNLKSYSSNPVGKAPSLPTSGFCYPCYYRDNMYIKTGEYTCEIKIFRDNDWVWLPVRLRKSDIDYVNHHCKSRKECTPYLQKKGKEWFLNFPYKEQTELVNPDINNTRILSVDLGINCAATVSVMYADGTVIGRRFLHLPVEKDHLDKAVNRIKKAQSNGARRTPRLWASAKGINDDIAVKTATFIVDAAIFYDCDTIVFEHLDRKGKLKGSKKQKLHMWKSQYVQSMVTDKAHRLHMRISHVNAWGTSKYAYDGSGTVERGIDGNYSICRFANGKLYNCDLSASYNIGARYFIREILKSLPETARLELEAKVPQVSRRSTCTYSTLININAGLCEMMSHAS